MSFFSSLKKEVSKFSQDVSRGVDSLAKDVNKGVDEIWSSPLLDAFSTGNVVQVISRSSGRALQIVTAANGQLVVDGLGQEGPQAYNAHWMITNHGKNVVSLQNQNNFLALQNGTLYIAHIPQGSLAGLETRFRLSQIDKIFVMLISKKEENCRIGILNTGQLKSPLATGSEPDAHFGVRLIHTSLTTTAKQKPGKTKTTVGPTATTTAATAATGAAAAAATQYSHPTGQYSYPAGQYSNPTGPAAEAPTYSYNNPKEVEALSQPQQQNAESHHAPMRPPPPYTVVVGACAPPPYPGQDPSVAPPPTNPGYQSVKGNPSYPDVS